MKSCIRILMSTVIASTAIVLGPSAATAQQGPGIAKVGDLVPLKVVIVISRYQGEKKVSSLPYTLLVQRERSRLNIARNAEPARRTVANRGRVPVPSMASPKETPVQGPFGPVQYKSIGTNIDCSARSTDDGRFRLDISIEDSSVYAEGQSAQGVPKFSDIPSFRSFQTSNALILKDGQSTEFTAAADRITGDVTKVVVTVTVVK